MRGDTSPLFVFEHRCGVPVLRFYGEIDWTNGERVRESLLQLDALTTTGAVIDLQHVPLAIASVFGSIDSLANRMRVSDRTLIAVSPPDCFATQVFRLLRYSHTTVDCVEAAIAMLQIRNADLQAAT